MCRPKNAEWVTAFVPRVLIARLKKLLQDSGDRPAEGVVVLKPSPTNAGSAL